MKSYIPDNLPIKGIDYLRLFASTVAANSELSRYDGLLQGIVNPAVMLSPMETREAVLSSKIEGTQATVDEVLEQEAGINHTGEKHEDINEIVNYRTALRESYRYLGDHPVTLSVIREIHRMLLDSVRGQNKRPGEFRLYQNWIGRPGTSIEEATYVPPSPMQVQDFLEDWVKYVQGDDKDVLVQAAVMHAQFELIHPFLDGNGRVGRILIPLFLYQKKKISQPMFYLSSYLEAHCQEYYSKLRAISNEGDWNGWIEFFLNAVTAQAKENGLKVKAILSLYEEMKERIQYVSHSQFSIQLLDFIFRRPVFKTSAFSKETGIPRPTALKLLGRLKSEGIVTERRKASGSQAGVLSFSRLLAIVEEPGN